MWEAWAAAGLLLVALAFALRVAVHAGRPPSGVDTWYYLAYADAFRGRPSLNVRLPQYLLQDERQSYPPLFPALLALLPSAFLRRFFWTVSPAIDCVHLLLLYWLAFRITGSLSVAVATGAIFAFTPQLVAETRSLNARSFGALLHSLAMVLLLRFALGADSAAWLAPALLAGALVWLASATAAAGYGIACAVLSLAFGDVRYLAVAVASGLLALAISAGHLLRVIANYAQAIAYWRRNRRLFGAHPIRHSPIYGSSSPPPARDTQPGFLGTSTAGQLLRLLGENPFILALPLAPLGVPPWGTRLYVWAMALTALAVLATLLPPLRAFGPGRSFLKTAVFPTAYTLAVGLGGVHGFRTRLGHATLLGLLLSVLAIGFFWAYTRRRSTQTAAVPPGLAEAAADLASRPSGGVLCLPYMYADYVAYHSGQPILWGGHCGDLRRFEALAPVITVPLPDLCRTCGVRYALIDSTYAAPRDVGLEGARRLARFGPFDLFALDAAGPPQGNAA